ncbi:MAG: energy transducer TonB [Crocinitomicaceae bacterium]|nr:energy transducer TonB [Crocinitomicaceae bacterium]
MKLEIKEPCHEDWDKMKVGLISRHCEVCEKGVVDFTKMNRAEIITHILSNPNEQICGRLTSDQFDFRHEDIPILIEALKDKRISNPFLILVLVSLSLSSCQQEPSIDYLDEEDPIEVTQGMVQCDETAFDQGISKQNIGSGSQLNLKKGHQMFEEMGQVMLMHTDIPQSLISTVTLSCDANERKVFQFVNVMPEFKGGIRGLESYVKRNLIYPEFERKHIIQGNVYVKFIVEADGSITAAQIVQSVSGSKNFDEEVLRLINGMPKWKPGTNTGKPLAVQMNLPIRFSLK